MKKITNLLAMVILVFFVFSCSNVVTTGNESSEQAESETKSLVELSGEISRANGGGKIQGFTANVMAPLHVSTYMDLYKNDNVTTMDKAWERFDEQLRTMKSNGADAVSVDVWWGDVEKVHDVYDWSYYTKIFDKITDAGLDVVAIMSFHETIPGGNVGDTYESRVPVLNDNRDSSWSLFIAEKGLTVDDLKYRSENGVHSTEFVSLWADEVIKEEYIEFMEEFEKEFGDMAADFDEINISCGPAGELRYPSYNYHDKAGGYPGRGRFQFYGSLAVKDFRDSMKSKYGNNIDLLNTAWKSELTSFDDIKVPENPESFVAGNDYEDTEYGKDLIFWYNDSLREHGVTMINAAESAFDGAFSDVVIAVKTAGVHWRMSDDNNPRIAEIAAGLIHTSYDYKADSTGHGYNNLLSALTGTTREINLHFTCLEMKNKKYDNDGKNCESLATDLVFWIGSAANDLGITLKGENALPGDIRYNSDAWARIYNVFDWSNYSGLTVLRMSDITDYSTAANGFKELINKYKPFTEPDIIPVTFTVKNAATSPGTSVYIVGDQTQIGSWNPANAVKLSCPNYPDWTGTINLPAGQTVKWKAIKRSENNPGQVYEWQSGSDNIIPVPATGTYSVEVTF